MTEQAHTPNTEADEFDPLALADSIRRQGVPSDFEATLAAILADDPT